MPESALSSPQETTSDERTMAVLAHALQLVGTWIAPLVIFLVKRDSRFVAFHALQALILQILYMLFIMFFMVAWFGLIFSQVFRSQDQHAAQPPLAFFIAFPLIWLFFMGWWIFVLVMVILYSIKAGRGEWAEYPVIGKLVRRILKIGPGGVSLPA